MAQKFGRLLPPDWGHIEKYPITKVFGVEKPPVVVEKIIQEPRMRWYYNQRNLNACVGYSCSWMMSVYNRKLYDAKWLYYRATEVDMIPWTTPESDLGTTVRAGFHILQTQGHKRALNVNSSTPTIETPNIADGISSYYWCTTVDQIRQAIYNDRPAVLGINWYEDFQQPTKRASGWWIGTGPLGNILGGHAIMCNGASDSRQAFRLVNSWGYSYPPVWIFYHVIERLLKEQGEAGVAYDRKP